MSPDLQYMRNFVSNYYGEDKLGWHEQVFRMPDEQVMAIYFRMIENPPKPGEPPPLEFPEIKKEPPNDTLF